MKDNFLTQEMIERSVKHNGNKYRLLKLFEKASRGEEITFVALGGSITQRYNASSPELCYAALLVKWMKEKFPNSKINYVNAGIGATGSLMAVHRLKMDVLKFRPDFVTVEFSVNEGDGEFTKKVYDNLIYNLLSSETKPAVLALCMVNCNGGSAQNTHYEVAKHYDIPMISYRDTVWPEIEAGRIEWSCVSNDNIHPDDTGHAIVAQIVTDFLESLSESSIKDEKDIYPIEPLTNNDFRNADIYYVDDIVPISYGCFKRERVDLNKIPYGFVASENGEPLKFNFNNCRRIYLLFEKTNKGNGGKALVRAGEKEVELDADFKDGWGVYYNNACVFESAVPTKVTLSIIPQLEDGKHFAVAGIMVS